MADLKKFAEGPPGMKDIRIAELNDGRIFVHTRPQGIIPALISTPVQGKIGFVILDNLRDLNPQRILEAKLIDFPITKDEWAGADEIEPLPDGRLRVLMHVARWDAQHVREYLSGEYKIDPTTGEVSGAVLLERADLPDGLNGESKRADLKNVVSAVVSEITGMAPPPYMLALETLRFTRFVFATLFLKCHRCRHTFPES